MIFKYITETHHCGKIPVEIKKRLTQLENSGKVKIIRKEITTECLKNFVES